METETGEGHPRLPKSVEEGLGLLTNSYSTVVTQGLKLVSSPQAWGSLVSGHVSHTVAPLVFTPVKRIHPSLLSAGDDKILVFTSVKRIHSAGAVMIYHQLTWLLPKSLN